MMIPKYTKQFISKLISTEKDISFRHFKKKVFDHSLDTSQGWTFSNKKIWCKAYTEKSMFWIATKKFITINYNMLNIWWFLRIWRKQFISKLIAMERDISFWHFKKKVFDHSLDTSQGQTFGNNIIMIQCIMIQANYEAILR